MASNPNTSVNQTRNNTYTYSPDVVPKTSASGSKSFNYSEVYSSNANQSSASKTKNKSNTPSAKGVLGITMGQTQNFTLFIDGICQADNAFTLLSKSGRFLPLKSMDFKPYAMEHLKLKAGVISDLPFFHRARLGSLTCVMWDSHLSKLSRKLMNWFNGCVSMSSGVVPYIDDMCKTAEYIEYTYDGKVAVKYQFAVIPDGELSTSRTYDTEGALTEYKFNLTIVSDIKVYANNKWLEAGDGDGTGEDADYERVVKAEKAQI